MTDERETPGTHVGPGAEWPAAFLGEVIKAQGMAMSQAQNWSIEVMAAYRQQAEEYGAVLQAVNRLLQAAERSQLAMADLAESHAKATKALSDSVDASRELVSTAEASNRKGLERLESLVTGMVEQVGGQVATLSEQMPMTSSTVTGPLAAQNAAFSELTRTWMDAFNSLLSGGIAGRRDAGQGEGP
jgi:hypothetical protein